jgi:glycine C-acetyltransferase/8-amino-7-oxononanoate synthase
VVVTDSVFSMDGDVAPLEEIVYVARSFGARVVVDEAHATGCLGPGGRGAVAEAGVEVDVVVGTLGKALGSYGAYVCASAEMIRYLVNVARQFIFSTAPSPPAIAGALAALALLRERPERVQRVHSNARVLRRSLAAEGFPVNDGELPIVPLIVGDAREATRFCQAALAGGLFAQAIRPPTVPDGSSRLRLTAMASHTHSELELAAAVLSDAAREAGIDPGALQAPPPERVPDPEPVALDAEFEAHFGEGLRGALFDGEQDLASDLPETAPFDIEQDPSRATASEDAPFDGELDREPERRSAPVAAAPFDHEHARASAA